MSIKKFIPLISKKPIAEHFNIAILTPLWHLGEGGEIICHEERLATYPVYKRNSADVVRIEVEYSKTRRRFEIYPIEEAQAIREVFKKGKKPWKPYGKHPLVCTVDSFVDVFDKAIKAKNKRATNLLQSLCN